MWLPVPPEEIEGIPEGLNYRFWNGEEDFPADPADCVYYVVPYMKPVEVVLRPMPRLSSVQVVQTLSAGTDAVEPGLKHLRPGVRLCNARGVHEASTAELALTLVLASLRGVPGFVRAQDRGEWRGGFRPALADRDVVVVGYGSIGSAIEDRLVPFEVARVARVARSGRTTARGPVHPLTELPSLLPEADVVILSTPLSETTRHLVNADFLARMKDGALLVNVARGPVVDTKARNPRAAASPPPSTSPTPSRCPRATPWWHAPGVLISPHVGGPTSAFLPRAKRLLVDQLNPFC
ncbi:Dihydrofolate reductase OS=Streptomyces alboniger OX=132473 GN=CP975_25295 PE=3 SV=1 [Streptomyces alboniger]